jgi:hypothetical protein
MPVLAPSWNSPLTFAASEADGVKSAMAHFTPATAAVCSERARIPATDPPGRCRPDTYACTRVLALTPERAVTRVCAVTRVWAVTRVSVLAEAAGAATANSPQVPSASVPASVPDSVADIIAGSVRRAARARVNPASKLRILTRFPPKYVTMRPFRDT